MNAGKYWQVHNLHHPYFLFQFIIFKLFLYVYFLWSTLICCNIAARGLTDIPYTWCIWWWLLFGGLANHVSIAKLNVCHLGYKHGFLSIQCSKPPIKNLANCNFRANRQIFDSPIIPCIRYMHDPEGAQHPRESADISVKP